MTVERRTKRSWVMAALGAAALLAGCFADGTSSSGGGFSSGPGPSAPAGSGSSSSSGGSSQPMLAVVDTGQTLTAQGGQGVGVFSEYQAGGHWHVWWTCDTTATSLSCAFQVDVTTSAAAGDAIANVSGSSTVAISTLAPHEVLATSSTTADVAGIHFDTTPGATITLDATVNGQDSGSFLFFVQDGKVNGGYQGTLTDPLMLQPSAP